MKLIFWTAFWNLVLDQLSKYFVVQVLALKDVGTIEVLPPFVTFRMAWNYGVNFGLFAQYDMRWVLIAIAFIIIGFVLYWMRRDGGSWGARFCAGLLIGGAVGNVIDRLIYGAVADFLNMSCCGIENPYAFNVADISIFVGAIGLVIFTGDPAPKEPRKKSA